MTTAGMPFDPHQPRYPSDDFMAGADGPPRDRPGGLTAVCVIAIVLGALGLCGSLFALGIAAFQESIEKTFAIQQQPGMPDGAIKTQMKMQKQMQEKTQEVGHRYRGANMGLGLLNLAFASCLLAGGIMTLKLNPTARSFLVGVFAAVIVFEIVRAVVLIFMQLDVAAAVSSVFKAGPGADQSAALVATAAKAMPFLGMAFGLAFGLAKMVFYGVGACYLRRPNIRRLFQPTATDPM